MPLDTCLLGLTTKNTQVSLLLSPIGRMGGENQSDSLLDPTLGTGTPNPAPCRKRVNLEIPIFGPGDAQLAVSLGAGRLELNAAGSYAAGGTTPSISELQSLIDQLTVLSGPNENSREVPIRIMIRPRGPPHLEPGFESQDGFGSWEQEQDFIYSPSEITSMIQSIRQFKLSGLLHASKGDGFVFGILQLRQEYTSTGYDPYGRVEIDAERNEQLVKEAWPFRCVFHRAFDDILPGCPTSVTMMMSPRDERKRQRERNQQIIDSKVETVRSLGFSGILTSGGKGNAFQAWNLDMLKMIASAAAGLETEGMYRIIGKAWDSAAAAELRSSDGDGDVIDEDLLNRAMKAPREVVPMLDDAQKERNKAPERETSPDERRLKVEIIVGGGVRSANLGWLREYLEDETETSDSAATAGGGYGKHSLFWYHSSCITNRSGENGGQVDGEEVTRLVKGLDPEEDLTTAPAPGDRAWEYMRTFFGDQMALNSEFTLGNMI